MHDLLWLLPGLPLLGSLVCGALHLAAVSRKPAAAQDDERAAGAAGFAPLVACGAMAGAFLVALWGFFQLLGHEHGALESATVWHWIDAGTLQIEVALVLDGLSSVMALVISGVGLLIHVYSIGYMKGDAGVVKYFAFLNLFVAAMMMLVLSSSLLGLFIGWEGVGLCSYLLIGFWYAKGWPAEAGQKAFVVNRIGDACFLVGSFLLVDLFGTLDMAAIGARVFDDPHVGGRLTLAALLLFGGCCGKSAQFPLFTWLPDAMAGPTPVSALIHAATMVTAGVYLVVRLNPVFAASPSAMAAIGIVGALTALIGASTALRQNDIKKVLAYSTVSQLGYMFLALGVGAWSAAIFHLVTHAFFKGLLFLGAGSVIHGMHEEQDMRRMGGLRRHMPTTYRTFLAGAAALSGLPLLSGFFSKDEILAMNWAAGGLGTGLWIVGLVAACLTAFYTWRMVALTFFGEERFDPAKVHPHESPSVMTVPLIVLAVLSVVGGLINLPPVLGGVSGKLHGWLHEVVAPGEELHHLPHLGGAMEWTLLGLGAFLALVFAHRGFHAYKHGPAADERLAERNPAAAGFLGRAWGIDDAYRSGIVEPLKLVAILVWTFVDQLLIDGAVNGTAAVARRCAARVRTWTDGNVKSYAIWIGAGAAALTLLWITV